MKIISIGEITLDRYPQLGRDFIGGISLNFAVNARRAGAESVSLVSRVGTDDAGRRALAKLAREDVDATHVAVLPGKTAEIEVQVHGGGERTFTPGGYHANVLVDFRLDEETLAFVAGHDVMATMADTLMGGVAFRQLLALEPFAGKRIADFGDFTERAADEERLQRALPHLDIAFLSGDQATVDALRPVTHRQDCLIVVTLGARGSVALKNGLAVFQPAMPVAEPVDTTGCGDAFQGTFSVVYLRTGSVETALAQAAARAAEVLGHYGATDS